MCMYVYHMWGTCVYVYHMWGMCVCQRLVLNVSLYYSTIKRKKEKKKDLFFCLSVCGYLHVGV